MPPWLRSALVAFQLLLPCAARAGEDIASLRPDEILEIEIQTAETRRFLPPNLLFRIQGGEPRRLACSIQHRNGPSPRLEQAYDSVLTPAMEENLQLWIDLFREVGVVQDTFYVVHQRFVLRRYAGGNLVKAEKRFDPHRMADLLIAYFEPELPAHFVPDGWLGIYGWYTPSSPPDTAGLGRIRRKIPDPVRYRKLDYPLARLPREVSGKGSARSRHERVLETLDSLSKGLE